MRRADLASPVVPRRRKAAEKPPMPAALESIAAGAVERHKKRVAQPGVTVEVAKSADAAYVVSSPHADHGAWEAMVCDALGTRSISTAQTFLLQLSELCSRNWQPAETEGGHGAWFPDERELNMVLQMVAGIKPRNEMEAALAAQMVAVHLMAMRVASNALSLGTGHIVPQDAAIAGKLARTFAMQMDAMAKLKGRKVAKQKITVRYERHEHKHVHVPGSGASSNSSGRAHDPCDGRNCGNNRGAPLVEHEGRPSLPGPDASGVVVPMSRQQGQEALSQARRGKRVGSAEG